MSKIDAARRAATRAEVQRRIWTVRPEVRAAKEDGSIPVSGHAAVFNTLSSPISTWWEGRYVEQILPGAFAKTLGECDCRMLINHDPNLILARYRGNDRGTAEGGAGNTLRLAEDNVGLLIDADMAPTSYAQDLALSMSRGDITQMSFAFQVIKDDWDETKEGTPRRSISEVKLFDVAPVTYPAYEETDIGLRAREADALFRAIGLGDMPQERRGALLGALLTHSPIPTDLLPDLRAARGALDELAGIAEPAAGHSAVDMGAIRRRLALADRALLS